MLGDALVRRSPFVHSYPCDWRTKKPVILRASRQWFVDTVGMKAEVIKAVEGVDIRWVQCIPLVRSAFFPGKIGLKSGLTLKAYKHARAGCSLELARLLQIGSRQKLT